MPKRLIVCSDGTWNRPDSHDITNVVKIARVLRAKDSTGIEQVVFYDRGVGTGNLGDEVKGGAFGEGLDENIQDAYRFLVHNHASGDQIFLFGFSRGAYTVRSLVGLIRNCRLLKKEHADKIPRSYKMYRSKAGPDVKSARTFRARFSKVVPIKFLGVWDTVGALGVPLRFFKGFNAKKYSFHDTTISGIIQNAYHALAIDEKRKPFKPTIWRSKKKRRNAGQVWFTGVHSDVGGGYPETGLSDIALEWMIQKAAGCGLAFNLKYLSRIMRKNARGKLHDSYTGKFKLLGEHVRLVGATSADESVHPSVWQRKNYQPRNLMKYMRR
ncbi:MAG: DUF2235 domain-containing protein [Candidatus Binatia bacterium]